MKKWMKIAVSIIIASYLVIISCTGYGLTDTYMKTCVKEYTIQFLKNSFTDLDSFRIKNINILKNEPLQVSKWLKFPMTRDVEFEINIIFFWKNHEIEIYKELIIYEMNKGIIDSCYALNYSKEIQKYDTLTIYKEFFFYKRPRPGNKTTDWELFGRYVKWEFLLNSNCFE